jgi:hypothetical protein
VPPLLLPVDIVGRNSQDASCCLAGATVRGWNGKWSRVDRLAGRGHGCI